MIASRRARVAFLSAYFGMYDNVMPAGFRQLQLASAARSREVIEGDAEVLDLGMIASDEEGRRAAERLADTRVDAIVYAPTMVAPPAWAQHVFGQSPAPVVIWNAPQILALPSRLDHIEATVNTTQVGCLMLANCLRRDGRWFATVTASPLRETDGARIRKVVRAATAAGSLQQAKVLRIGDPIAGYDDVAASPEALAELGVREYSVAKWELQAALDAVEDARANALLDDLRGRPNWCVPDATADLRSVRLAVALGAIAERHGAACGTINCHGPFFRDNSKVGITACLAMSLLGERGLPFSCTGDLPAGLSMFLAERLSGRAFYCETYTPDLERGSMLLASGGDGDPRWADENGVRTFANTYYKGLNGAGTGVTFRLAPGPATLISISPAAEGWRLAWATGEVLADGYDELDGPNGMFRFDRAPIEDAASAWIASGATHHHALARGRLDVELAIVADALGVTSVRV
jgi:L-fucose isomerase-like protein